MLLIFITSVLSNNLPLTFLRFPFWDSKIVPGELATLGSRVPMGKPWMSFGVPFLVSHLSLRLQQSQLCISIRIFRGPAWASLSSPCTSEWLFLEVRCAISLRAIQLVKSCPAPHYSG